MIFSIPDASCGHCKAAIETAIADAGGQAQVDLTKRTVTLTGIDADHARAVLDRAGYPATPVV